MRELGAEVDGVADGVPPDGVAASVAETGGAAAGTAVPAANDGVCVSYVAGVRRAEPHRAADLGNNGAGRLTALSVTLAREYLTLNQGVWLGDSAPLGNCQDWTSNLGEASVGVARRDDGDAFGVGNVACSDPGRLYCLEE